VTAAGDERLDLALDGLEPADRASAQAREILWPDDFDVLAHYRIRPDGSHSYVLAHDRTTTWGPPGEPQLVAIRAVRDFDSGTFTLEQTRHAQVPFAQAWLIEHGCPPEQIALPDDFMAPADESTRRIEQKIREGRQRYEVLETHTLDYDGPWETWTIVRDTHAADKPVRVFLEQADEKAFTYTLREGAFADHGAAWTWLDNRDGPLPPPPEEHTAAALRTRAAHARSNGPAGPRMACGLDGPFPAPPSLDPMARRPDPGRPR
jgi:hypothetical protein